MTPMQVDAYIDAAAEVAGLSIAPEYRAGVAEFFRGAAALAALLEQVELEDAELELAPVFRLPDCDGADG